MWGPSITAGGFRTTPALLAYSRPKYFYIAVCDLGRLNAVRANRGPRGFSFIPVRLPSDHQGSISRDSFVQKLDNLILAEPKNRRNYGTCAMGKIYDRTGQHEQGTVEAGGRYVVTASMNGGVLGHVNGRYVIQHAQDWHPRDPPEACDRLGW